jgi:hypothetical protein
MILLQPTPTCLGIKGLVVVLVVVDDSSPSSSTLYTNCCLDFFAFVSWVADSFYLLNKF